MAFQNKIPLDANSPLHDKTVRTEVKTALSQISKRLKDHPITTKNEATYFIQATFAGRYNFGPEGLKANELDFIWIDAIYSCMSYIQDLIPRFFADFETAKVYLTVTKKRFTDFVLERAFQALQTRKEPTLADLTNPGSNIPYQSRGMVVPSQSASWSASQSSVPYDPKSTPSGPNSALLPVAIHPGSAGSSRAETESSSLASTKPYSDPVSQSFPSYGDLSSGSAVILTHFPSSFSTQQHTSPTFSSTFTTTPGSPAAPVNRSSLQPSEPISYRPPGSGQAAPHVAAQMSYVSAGLFPPPLTPPTLSPASSAPYPLGSAHQDLLNLSIGQLGPQTNQVSLIASREILGSPVASNMDSKPSSPSLSSEFIIEKYFRPGSSEELRDITQLLAHSPFSVKRVKSISYPQLTKRFSVVCERYYQHRKVQADIFPLVSLSPPSDLLPVLFQEKNQPLSDKLNQFTSSPSELAKLQPRPTSIVICEVMGNAATPSKDGKIHEIKHSSATYPCYLVEIEWPQPT